MLNFWKASASAAVLAVALAAPLRAESNEEETPLLPLGGSLLFQLNPNIDNSGTAYSVFIFGQPGTTGAVNGPSFN
jgi:hypothetical protein